MEEPDYDSYDLETLRDIKAHIDKEAFPERYEKITTILNDPVRLKKLEKDHSIIVECKKKDKRKDVTAIAALICALFFFGHGLVILLWGTIHMRYSSDINIESMPARIGLFIILSWVSYICCSVLRGNSENH